jgi:hypothetical protein
MRNNLLSNDLLPVEYHSHVSKNDPCRKSVRVEEIPDPTPFPVLEDDKEVVVSESNYSVPGISQKIEEHECCVSVKTGNCGCVHVTATDNSDEDEPAEVEFKKSPRQKFIDKVKSKTASALDYSKRASCLSKFSPKKKRDDEKFGSEPKAWEPDDIKSREKKVPQKGKRSQRVAVVKMKVTGPPVREDFSIEESLPDVE